MEKRQTRSQTAKNPDASFQSLDTSTRKSLRKRFNLNSSSINETLTPPLSVLESGDSDLEISRNLNFEKFSQKEVVNIEKESDFEYFEKEKRKTFDILSPGADFNVKKYNLDQNYFYFIIVVNVHRAKSDYNIFKLAFLCVDNIFAETNIYFTCFIISFFRHR